MDTFWVRSDIRKTYRNNISTIDRICEIITTKYNLFKIDVNNLSNDLIIKLDNDFIKFKEQYETSNRLKSSFESDLIGEFGINLLSTYVMEFINKFYDIYDKETIRRLKYQSRWE